VRSDKVMFVKAVLEFPLSVLVMLICGT